MGLWLFSLVSDFISIFRGGDAFWNNVAFYTMQCYRQRFSANIKRRIYG